MSSQIEQIRSIISDKPQHVTEQIQVAAGQTVVRLTYSPIDIVTGVTVNPASANTVDYDQAVVTFNAAPGAGTYTFDYAALLLSDDTIQDFIDVENSFTDDGVSGDIRLMAADALDAMASNMALLLRRITLQDLQTDGSSVAATLRAGATALRDQVYNPKYQEPAFDIVEQINDLPGFREKILKDWMRQEP